MLCEARKVSLTPSARIKIPTTKALRHCDTVGSFISQKKLETDDYTPVVTKRLPMREKGKQNLAAYRRLWRRMFYAAILHASQ
jgi:hypothetical protein